MKDDQILDKFPIAHSKIKTANRILIVSPAPPDADSIASCLLLSEYLKLPWLKKPHTLYCAQRMPRPEENLLFRFFKSDLLQFSHDLPKIRPTCIALADYGSFKTAELHASDFTDAEFIGFDHHDQPADDFPENGLQITDPEAASTTTLLYHYFCYIGVPISKIMATYVTIGILADTGRLTNPRANADALRIVANCIEKGIPWEEIKEAVKPHITANQLKTQQKCLKKLKVDQNIGLASLLVDQQMLKKWSATPREIMTFMGIMQSLEDIKVAVVILEGEGGTWRVSLRSRDQRKFPISEVARTLGGGGHKNAAAAQINTDPQVALSIIKSWLNAIN